MKKEETRPSEGEATAVSVPRGKVDGAENIFSGEAGKALCKAMAEV